MKYMRFHIAAEVAAAQSKGVNTKVGCVLVAPDLSITVTGYNGAPRGCAADEPGDIRGEKPEKYYWIEHAERNAIYNAARNGVSVKNFTAVITHPPCMDCARAMIQVGIKTVLWKKGSEKFNAIWGEHVQRSIALFTECGIDFQITE